MQTTVVGAVTSNLRLAEMPGNVRLRKREAGLDRPSVINVALLRTLDKSRLTDRMGRLSAARMHEVLAGLALVLGTSADCL